MSAAETAGSVDFPNLHFLKLGGSLITDKTRPRTPQVEIIERLAGEIQAARQAAPVFRLPLVIGHGSGSFGHVPARRYGTRLGVRSTEDWQGFVEVWFEAQALNRLVLDGLVSAGLPVVGLSPLASVSAEDGRIAGWDLGPMRAALQAGLIPVVYGDVVFDTMRGGTILSTEDLFGHLAAGLQPQRILLAGIEPGVWEDYPACTRLAAEITPASFERLAGGLSGSAATDVTGGMAAKVSQSLRLARVVPGLQVWIFSGLRPGAMRDALTGNPSGTLIRA